MPRQIYLIVDDPLDWAGEQPNAENINGLVLVFDSKEQLADLYRVIGDAVAVHQDRPRAAMRATGGAGVGKRTEGASCPLCRG